jgi:hypothetical protein
VRDAGTRADRVATAARRVATPLALARVRLSNRSTSVALLSAGLLVGAAIVAAVIGGGLLTQDRHLSRSLAELPAGHRSIQVAHFGAPAGGQSFSQLDALVRRDLADLGLGEPLRVVQYKVLRLGSTRVLIAGLDDVRRWIRLERGRLPAPCSPRRCEVVVVRGRGRVDGEPAVPLVAVGRGRIASPLPFGRIGTGGGETSETLGEREPSTFVVASGVAAAADMPGLQSIYRSYLWIAGLHEDDVRPWNVDALGGGLDRAQSALDAVSSGFDVATPLARLQEDAGSGRLGGRRLLLVGGQAAALLLAFAAFAAATMRRDVDATWRRLTWFGARRWQLIALTAAETMVVAVAAIAVGWLLGAAVTAWLAHRVGSPPGDIVRHSLASGSGVAIALGLCLLATIVTFVALRVGELPLGGRSVSPLDVAAAGAAVAVFLTISRGRADADTVARGGGTGTFLLLLPGLVLFVAAVGSARLLTPLLRSVQRVAHRTAVPVRLAALSVARRPGYAVVATAFLVVSLALALFALVYRSTLVEGIDDQVDYAFPVDFVVREDLAPERLVLPLQAAPLTRYRAAAPDVWAQPVIRQHAGVSRIASTSSATLLGLPAAALPPLRGWRDDFSSLSLSEVQARVEAPAGIELRGDAIPADASGLSLRASALGDDVSIVASVRTRDGAFTTVTLGPTRGNTPRTLAAPLPARARGGLLLGLELQRTLGVEGHAQGNVPTLRGVLVLGPLTARRPGARAALVSRYAGWTGTGGVEPLPGRGAAHLGYFVSSSAEARFRTVQATDREPLAAIVSPGLARSAAADGTLPISVPAGRIVVRVAGVAERFPTVAGEFALVDERALAVALDTVRPGAAVVNEVWLDAGSGAARGRLAQALTRPPFDVLAVSAREPFADDLRTEPLARGTTLILISAAAVSILLALIGLALLVAADLRDEEGELFDLEAQGASPALLRRHTALRVALVGMPALLGAIAASIVLAGLVVDFVALTAAAATPQPPLRLAVDWGLIVAVLTLYAAVAVLTIAIVLRSSFRAPTPTASFT